jgi:hypothetical protein
MFYPNVEIHMNKAAPLWASAKINNFAEVMTWPSGW